MVVSTILPGIFIFALTGILHRWRIGILLVLSAAAVCWLQPDLPAAILSGVFPLLSILLVILTWMIVRPSDSVHPGSLLFLAVGLIAGMVAMKPENLPSLRQTSAVVILGVGTLTGFSQFVRDDTARRKQSAGMLILVMIALLLILKYPPAAIFFSQLIQSAAGEESINAGISDLQWIGISYIVLRLIAVLIDFRKDQLPALSLEELLIFTLFPASLLAGPIDRAQRFAADLRNPAALDSARVLYCGKRIASGLIKKFVMADTLALVALSADIAPDTKGIFGAWIIAYIYAFQIFFDFSGYSDIAIGIGGLVGIDLPENFDRPYLRQNLSQFWQNWHMSLTTWFRAYCFVPFSRWMLRRKIPVSDYFIAQVVTMALIGLWHGVTVNFILWGLWHALGLYAHRLLASRTRSWYLRVRQRTWANRLIYAGGVLATFHFVVMGWVFFALPDPAMSFDYLQKMFGIA